MEKAKREHRILQMKYPSPYSQSWSGTGYRKGFIGNKNPSKSNAGADISKRCSGEKSDSRHGLESQHRFVGLDPTVPHIKYGVFPKKTLVSRGQSRIVTVKPSVRTSDEAKRDRISSGKKSVIAEHNRLKTERPAVTKTATVQKLLQSNPKAQEESSEGPVFVFRPLEHRSLRSLTMSASTHLDIKPRPQRGLMLSPQPYNRYL